MMDEKRFNALLPLKIATVIGCMKQDGYDEDTAIGLMYTSKLYQSLSSEDTKMWWYGPRLLADLLEEELKTGTFAYPDN